MKTSKITMITTALALTMLIPSAIALAQLPNGVSKCISLSNFSGQQSLDSKDVLVLKNAYNCKKKAERSEAEHLGTYRNDTDFITNGSQQLQYYQNHQYYYQDPYQQNYNNSIIVPLYNNNYQYPYSY